MKFIDKHMKEMKRRTRIPTVMKKVLFLKLQFLKDATEEIVTWRLRKAAQKTFNAVKLSNIFYNRPTIRTVNKDKLSEFTISMCIYQFNCFCGANYKRRTIRQVRQRIIEHYPSWLSK
uniref:Uncharacterized protein n=1 Tax=Schistosoma mansoni TaxID=6183 RepID=Q4QQD6_SCHMA|nr:TPA: hypothetical protein [Schistosoma mansoni]